LLEEAAAKKRLFAHEPPTELPPHRLDRAMLHTFGAEKKARHPVLKQALPRAVDWRFSRWGILT
jgi:hypothetical protein